MLYERLQKGRVEYNEHLDKAIKNKIMEMCKDLKSDGRRDLGPPRNVRKIVYDSDQEIHYNKGRRRTIKGELIKRSC